MNYLTFIRHSESYRQGPPPQALMEAMGNFVQWTSDAPTAVD